MKRRAIVVASLALVGLLPVFLFVAQLGGARWWAIPLAEDPGVSWMVLTETSEYRILRDFAKPGATRHMHNHADASWHVLTLTTGSLRLTVEGDTAMNVTPGRPVALKGGVMHTFTNTGTELATIVEVFGKAHP